MPYLGMLVIWPMVIGVKDTFYIDADWPNHLVQLLINLAHSIDQMSL